MDETTEISISVAEIAKATGSRFSGFFSALVKVFAGYIHSARTLIQETKPHNLKSHYDFIIIGAGSAGSVVTNRLTEVGDWNVLLLEAGGDETELTDIPCLTRYLQMTPLDWNYTSQPQVNGCKAMDENLCKWPRGRTLGGSSVINFMDYARGNRRDYDGWRRMGNEGWSYENVLPYFKKSEDNLNNKHNKNAQYHSIGGYLPVSKLPYSTGMLETFLSAGRESGYRVRDLNAKYQTGFMEIQSTTKSGARYSAAKAFLRPIADRENLDITMHAFVRKILIDRSTNKAYGVEFERNGIVYTINATKEVILSAGAINSPQILMLSGVGPKEELKKHSIRLIKDLKVGENLHDHVGLGGLTFVINKTLSLKPDRVFTVRNVLQYSALGNGPLTTLAGVEGVAYVNTKYANTSIDYPDIGFFFVAGSANSDDGTQMKKIHGLTDDFFDETFKAISNEDTYSIIPLLLRPESRGIVKLNSRNPTDNPLIYPNYFLRSTDMRVLVEGVKLAIDLSQTNAFQTIGSTLYKFPRCNFFSQLVDQLQCMIKSYTFVGYNPVGTCKMGPSWDANAVVDPSLRLYGIESLRVIDASIMPTIPSSSINAVVTMIGEKGADMIKNFWL